MHTKNSQNHPNTSTDWEENPCFAQNFSSSLSSNVKHKFWVKQEICIISQTKNLPQSLIAPKHSYTMLVNCRILPVLCCPFLASLIMTNKELAKFLQLTTTYPQNGLKNQLFLSLCPQILNLRLKSGRRQEVKTFKLGVLGDHQEGPRSVTLRSQRCASTEEKKIKQVIWGQISFIFEPQPLFHLNLDGYAFLETFPLC